MMVIIIIFYPWNIWSRGRWKIKKMDIQIGVRSSICAVSGWQTVVQKDSILALYQHRDPLIQEVGLSSLARARSDPPSQVVKEGAGSAGLMRWKCPRYLPQSAQRSSGHWGQHTSPPCGWLPSLLLLHLPQKQLYRRVTRQVGMLHYYYY